jgi:Flp pilus assembly protein TadD
MLSLSPPHLQALQEPATKLGDWTPSQLYEARASANFKRGAFMEAVQDASKAIELDATNVKAFLRKG